MPRTGELPRRSFLASAASLLLGLTTPLRIGEAQENRFGDIGALLGDHIPAARAIGRAYLSQPGNEERARRTLHEFPVRGRAASYDVPRRLQALREKDFADGALFIHEGWVFAEIEARICALVALS